MKPALPGRPDRNEGSGTIWDEYFSGKRARLSAACGVNTLKTMKSNRRSFIKTSALGTLGVLGAPALLGNSTASPQASENEKPRGIKLPELRTKAVDGRPLKAGLVGCGDRGTGAAMDFLAAGDGLQVTALGDLFKDHLDNSREKLQKKGLVVPDDKCFTGFDAYKRVIDSGVDVVLLCTPPVFRPLHFEYAVNAGKDCFIEKPVAVDPAGARRMLAIGKLAAGKNLSVISGTIRRSEKNCIELCRRVADGAIGRLVSAHVIRHGTVPVPPKARASGWSDMEFMLRNWMYYTWTSSDFNCEQFIHEVDLMSMFLGDIPPVRAIATGGRARRPAGNIYDSISVEYEYEGSFRAHCTSRQINGCDRMNAVLIYGTKGYTDCRNWIRNLDCTDAWVYPRPDAAARTAEWKILHNGLIQEHVRLVSAIRTGKPVNDVEQQVLSNIIGMMGRESAYTGKFVTYEEMMASQQNLTPATWEFGPVPGVVTDVALPGVAL